MTVQVGEVKTFDYADIMKWAQVNAQATNGEMQAWFEGASRFGVGEQDALVDYLNSISASVGNQDIARRTGEEHAL